MTCTVRIGNEKNNIFFFLGGGGGGVEVVEQQFLKAHILEIFVDNFSNY